MGSSSNSASFNIVAYVFSVSTICNTVDIELIFKFLLNIGQHVWSDIGLFNSRNNPSQLRQVAVAGTHSPSHNPIERNDMKSGDLEATVRGESHPEKYVQSNDVEL